MSALSQSFCGDSGRNRSVSSVITPASTGNHHRARSTGRNDMISVGEMVSMQNPHSSWEIPGYTVPRNTGLQKRNPEVLFLKSKRKDINPRKDVSPSPDKYDLKMQWGTNSGRFAKGSRNSELDTIIKNAKKRSSPGPGAYNGDKKKKITGGLTSKSQRTSFLDEVRHLAALNPAATSYNPVDISKPKMSTFKYYTDKNKGDEFKIKKTNQPGPGTFDVLGSYHKLTDSKAKPFIAKAKKVPSFLTVNNTKTPGVGSYSFDKDHLITKGVRRRR